VWIRERVRGRGAGTQRVKQRERRGWVSTARPCRKLASKKRAKSGDGKNATAEEAGLDLMSATQLRYRMILPKTDKWARVAKHLAVAAGTSLAVGQMAQATVLTFVNDAGGGLGNFGALSQAYGDNVSAATQGGFGYGADFGFTPNITADYGTNGAGTATTWDTAYGDLLNVVYASQGAAFELTLTAEEGFFVQLHGFDLGGWSFTDYIINSVQVLDGGGAVLFGQSEVAIEGTNGHTDFDFGLPLSAAVLRIRFDATNLGGNSDNIGIDNVAFSQTTVIPEPATAGVLAAALALGLAVGARRRRSTTN
jgi:hypothetical protein